MTSRRGFMKASAAAGVGYWVAGGVKPSRARAQAKNEKIQFACIGVDGKGASDSADAGRNGEVVAICDVDDKSIAKAAARFPNAKKYFDYREMLSEVGDTVDAVTVSTPDHNHACASVMAMRMGKHCFTQKPLTHSIYEARTMRDVAKESGVVTQMGNQGTALDKLREGAAIMQSGALGNVTEVHVWTNRPVWPQGDVDVSDKPPVPKTLHWDQWIGPAPYVAYHGAYHPFKWRGFWSFGTGALGDMACHTLNMAYMGLELRDPTAVEAESSGHNKITYPGWSKINFDFPARTLTGGNKRGPIKMIWYDGGKRPDASLFEGFVGKDGKPFQMDESGTLVLGDKAKLVSPGPSGEGRDYGGSYQIHGMEAPTVEFTKSPGHFKEFAQAIQGEGKTVSNFPEYAGPLTETILLGNLAVWSGKRVEWDAETITPTNSPELASIVRREYRDGWSLEPAATATS